MDHMDQEELKQAFYTARRSWERDLSYNFAKANRKTKESLFVQRVMLLLSIEEALARGLASRPPILARGLEGAEATEAKALVKKIAAWLAEKYNSASAIDAALKARKYTVRVMLSKKSLKVDSKLVEDILGRHGFKLRDGKFVR
jgi:hypothetical protein